MRKKLHSGILDKDMVDLADGNTKQEILNFTKLCLTQSYRAYNTDDAMNAAMLASMMFLSASPTSDSVSGKTAGEVYQRFFLDSLPNRKAIIKCIMEKTDAGEASTKFSEAWGAYLQSEAAAEARESAMEIQRLRMRISELEQQIKETNEKTFQAAVDLALKMQTQLYGKK